MQPDFLQFLLSFLPYQMDDCVMPHTMHGPPSIITCAHAGQAQGR